MRSQRDKSLVSVRELHLLMNPTPQVPESGDYSIWWKQATKVILRMARCCKYSYRS